MNEKAKEAPNERRPQPGEPAKNQRKLVGRVVSDKMQKTVSVRGRAPREHPMMGKTITRSKKYHAHDEAASSDEGDLVEIAECRPISRTKAWRVAKLASARPE